MHCWRVAKRSAWRSPGVSRQLSPRGWARAAASAAGAAGTAARSGRHPLAWLVALAAVVFLNNPRSALLLLGRTRTALRWATRAAEVLSLLGALRKTGLRKTGERRTALRRAH